MFRILADSMMTATRHETWVPPTYWRDTHAREADRIADVCAENRLLRRWLRDTGIL